MMANYARPPRDKAELRKWGATRRTLSRWRANSVLAGELYEATSSQQLGGDAGDAPQVMHSLRFAAGEVRFVEEKRVCR